MKEIGIWLLVSYISYVFIPKRTKFYSVLDGFVFALSIHLMMGWK